MSLSELQIVSTVGDHEFYTSPLGRGRRAAPGERLSEKSSCIGVCGTRIACFCVEPDEQFARERDADHHFFFSFGAQSVAGRAEALVEARGGSGNEEQDRTNAGTSAANRPLAPSLATVVSDRGNAHELGNRPVGECA